MHRERNEEKRKRSEEFVVQEREENENINYKKRDKEKRRKKVRTGKTKRIQWRKSFVSEQKSGKKEEEDGGLCYSGKGKKGKEREKKNESVE